MRKLFNLLDAGAKKIGCLDMSMSLTRVGNPA